VIKLGEVVMLLDLHRQGLTVSAIARELGLDRKTVRKCIKRGLDAPVYGPRKPRQRLIDPFVPYLRAPFFGFILALIIPGALIVLLAALLMTGR